MVAGKITAVTIDYVTSPEPVRQKVVHLDEELNKQWCCDTTAKTNNGYWSKMETDNLFQLTLLRWLMIKT